MIEPKTESIGFVSKIPFSGHYSEAIESKKIQIKVKR